MVQDKSGILETSLDDPIVYEPNRTVDESDDEQDKEKKPLEEQIALLDEEITKPSMAAELNLSAAPPVKSKSPVVAKKSGGGMCAKAMMLSVLLSLIIAAVLFYVVFFSNVKHPMVPKLRQNLKFLEPVADFVGKQAKSAASLFKKK